MPEDYYYDSKKKINQQKPLNKLCNRPTLERQVNKGIQTLVNTRKNQFVVSNQSLSETKEKFQAFISANPVWEASLFDSHFYSHTMVKMIKQARKNKLSVSANQVAIAWSNQVNLNQSSKLDLVEELAAHINTII